jgi:hypothetical protein
LFILPWPIFLFFYWQDISSTFRGPFWAKLSYVKGGGQSQSKVSPVSESNPAREQRFLNDALKRARNLEAEYPGSSFEKTLMSYGQNGKYLVLVDGPFGNLSEGFNVLVDFLARVRAFRQINRWKMSPNWALALNRHALTQQFGSLAALLWAQHISGRFRCAVSKDTNRLTGTDTDFVRFFSNRRRGGFRGRFVPGA